MQRNSDKESELESVPFVSPWAIIFLHLIGQGKSANHAAQFLSTLTREQVIPFASALQKINPALPQTTAKTPGITNDDIKLFSHGSVQESLISGLQGFDNKPSPVTTNGGDMKFFSHSTLQKSLISGLQGFGANSSPVTTNGDSVKLFSHGSVQESLISGLQGFDDAASPTCKF